MKRYTSWLKAAAILQLLTAAVHSLSFFIQRQPQNETEKQLFELLNTYKFDFGSGFQQSLGTIYKGLSGSFSLIFLMGGLILFYLLRMQIDHKVIKGVTGIYIIVYGAQFLVTLITAFLPPILMTGLVFLLLCFAYATNHIHFLSTKQD